MGLFVEHHDQCPLVFEDSPLVVALGFCAAPSFELQRIWLVGNDAVSRRSSCKMALTKPCCRTKGRQWTENNPGMFADDSFRWATTPTDKSIDCTDGLMPGDSDNFCC